MTMRPYDTETHFNRFRYPKGGVAPLGHELAIYEYVEKRRQYREQAARLDVMPIVPAVEWAWSFATGLFARLALPLKTAPRRQIASSGRSSANSPRSV